MRYTILCIANLKFYISQVYPTAIRFQFSRSPRLY